MRTNSVLLLAAPALLAVSACASPKDDDGVDSASDSAADTAIDTGEDTDSGDTGADSGDSGADSGDTDDGACNTTAMYAGCSGTVDYDFYGGTATGTMTWDADGNLLLNERIDDATGEVVRVESTYTDGRLATQVTTRNGAALADWTYTYDAAGTLIEATDAAQNLTNFYSYDADGHLVERGTDYFNDGTVDYRCTLTWTDGADGATSSFETCDNGSTISTDYDARGLVSRTEYSYSGYTVEQTNVWRDDCQLASASFVDSTTTGSATYTYDGMSRLTDYAYEKATYYWNWSVAYTCE